MYHTSRPRSGFRLYMHRGGRRHGVLRIKPSLFENKFAHVLITYNGEQMKLYVNGQPTGLAYSDTRAVRSPRDGPKQFFFGRNARFGGVRSRNSRNAFPGSFSSFVLEEGAHSQRRVISLRHLRGGAHSGESRPNGPLQSPNGAFPDVRAQLDAGL